MYDSFPPCVFADLEPRECQDFTLRIQRPRVIARKPLLSPTLQPTRIIDDVRREHLVFLVKDVIAQPLAVSKRGIRRIRAIRFVQDAINQGGARQNKSQTSELLQMLEVATREVTLRNRPETRTRPPCITKS